MWEKNSELLPTVHADLGPNSPARHVPRPGIEPALSHLAAWCPTYQVLFTDCLFYVLWQGIDPATPAYWDDTVTTGVPARAPLSLDYWLSSGRCPNLGWVCPGKARRTLVENNSSFGFCLQSLYGVFLSMASGSTSQAPLPRNLLISALGLPEDQFWRDEEVQIGSYKIVTGM